MFENLPFKNLNSNILLHMQLGQNNSVERKFQTQKLQYKPKTAVWV